MLVQPTETTKLREPLGGLFGLQEAPWEPKPNHTLLLEFPKIFDWFMLESGLVIIMQS